MLCRDIQWTAHKLYACVYMCVWENRYGVVLRKLDLLKEAVEVFVEAIHALPLHWGAWLELSNLVTNIEMVTSFVFTCTQIVEHCVMNYTQNENDLYVVVFAFICCFV